MTADDLEEYLASLGLNVGRVDGNDGTVFTTVRDVSIDAGPYRGCVRDVALQRVETVPYSPPSSIQVRPPLLPMNTNSPYGSQPSPQLGPEWQYLSRRFEHEVRPKELWAHVLTVLSRAPE